MMRRSVILRTAVTVVVALAVGVSATLVGAQFAAPPSALLIAPETETAPVIEPVGFGSDAPAGGIFDVA